jgi:hypothetical protein
MRRRWTVPGVLLGALLALGIASAARGANIEKLLMPGPVSQAHAKTEDSCAACHDKADRSRQSGLCLACHKDVAADLEAGKGLHGRMQGARSSQCQACHSEHHGRGFAIVSLSRASFDHEGTDFPLRGAHQDLHCESCHHSNEPYRKAPVNCIGCHRNDDAHRGSLGTDCHSCHAESAWRSVRFDHDKTAFPLRDHHQSIPCAACHAGERYKGTPKQCVGCHAPDDAHKGTRGTDCAKCHTSADWKSQKFDHARDTGFALLGRHARIACADCHRSGDLKAKIPKVCSGCHAGADSHEGRFGTDCGSCHGNELWRIENYDHAGRHKFALDGAHAKLDCHTCHTAVAKEQKLPQDCAGCHRADDVHGGALSSGCESCHNSVRWSENRFDHDLSSFPLVGLHVVVTCAQCHETQRFNDAPGRCVGCHAAQDVHKGSLGDDCAICHSSNGWKLVGSFDHGKRTRFPLTGAHQPLRCQACHIRPANEVKLSMECVACHQSDEVHGGQFGRKCERCHNTQTFRGGHAN